MSRVGYDVAAGRALLDLRTDMTYVLSQSTKYIKSVAGTRTQGMYQYRRRRQGARVLQPHRCSNRRLRAQVKTVIEQYELDGVNLWDRNSGYGKEGMPAVNTTSYPKLIKALREHLARKILTVTVYEDNRYFLGYGSDGRNRRRRLH